MVTGRTLHSLMGKDQASAHGFISSFINNYSFLGGKSDSGFSFNKVIEAVLLPLVIPVLLFIFNANDIFLLETEFPWLIIVPIVIAARYGTWLGLLSLFVLALASLFYTFFYHEDLFNRAFNILAGDALIVVFVGEMLQFWKQQFTETVQQKSESDRFNDKVEQELQILHIAYSQLEENLVTTTQSVSDSLRLLEVSLQPSLDAKLQTKLAINKLHKILRQYQWLEESVFYYVNEDGVINPVPLASKARFVKDLHKDILVSKVIETKRAVVSNKKRNTVGNIGNSKLQAAIPLIDSQQRLWGVMAVIRMTPSIFTQQNLNLLSLLCSYVANLLSASLQPVTSAKSLHLETSTAIDIVLNSVRSVFFIRIHIPLTKGHNGYKAFFVNKIKGISRIWQLQKKDEIVLVILVPLFKKSTASIWQKQLETSFVKQFGKTPGQANIKISIQQLKRNSPLNHRKLDF